MKKLLLIPVLLVFVACATVKIGYDYDKSADFSKYKTYAVSEETTKMTNVAQLNRDRLIKAAKAEMAAKGFTESANPDVILDLRIKGKEVQTATATTSGYGYGPWGYGGSFSTTHVNYDNYVEGSLFITLVDKSTGKVVWQGTGKKTLDDNASADKKEKDINYAVKQIFTNYPPK